FLYTERARGTWALPRVGLAAVGMLLLILPYTARQFVTYQRFILIDSTSGWNLWRDHRAPGDDFWTTVRSIPNPGDRDRYAFQRGLKNILADPAYQFAWQGAVNLATML